jgi:hypothetical protein
VAGQRDAAVAPQQALPGIVVLGAHGNSRATTPAQSPPWPVAPGLPRPWAPDDEHRLLKDALEQVELADRLGIDYVWEVEHHLQKWKFPPTRQ